MMKSLKDVIPAQEGIQGSTLLFCTHLACFNAAQPAKFCALRGVEGRGTSMPERSRRCGVRGHCRSPTAAAMDYADHKGSHGFSRNHMDAPIFLSVGIRAIRGKHFPPLPRPFPQGIGARIHFMKNSGYSLTSYNQ